MKMNVVTERFTQGKSNQLFLIQRQKLTQKERESLFEIAEGYKRFQQAKSADISKVREGSHGKRSTVVGYICRRHLEVAVVAVEENRGEVDSSMFGYI